MSFDIRCLVMEDVVELTGQKQPADTKPPERVCARCGGITTEGFIEITGRDAYLHDFTRLVRYCEDCLEVVDDD